MRIITSVVFLLLVSYQSLASDTEHTFELKCQSINHSTIYDDVAFTEKSANPFKVYFNLKKEFGGFTETSFMNMCFKIDETFFGGTEKIKICGKKPAKSSKKLKNMSWLVVLNNFGLLDYRGRSYTTMHETYGSGVYFHSIYWREQGNILRGALSETGFNGHIDLVLRSLTFTCDIAHLK